MKPYDESLEVVQDLPRSGAPLYQLEATEERPLRMEIVKKVLPNQMLFLMRALTFLFMQLFWT